MPKSTLLTLILQKREIARYRLDHLGRKVLSTPDIEVARAFVREWNTKHRTKSTQVWLRSERRLLDF